VHHHRQYHHGKQKKEKEKAVKKRDFEQRKGVQYWEMNSLWKTANTKKKSQGMQRQELSFV